MDLSKLNAIFVSESGELLERLEQALLAIEKEPQDEGSLRTIFQVMHTIKGNAATMGCSKMAEYAHHLEDGMERIKDGALKYEHVGARRDAGLSGHFPCPLAGVPIRSG